MADVAPAEPAAVRQDPATARRRGSRGRSRPSHSRVRRAEVRVAGHEPAGDREHAEAACMAPESGERVPGQALGGATGGRRPRVGEEPPQGDGLGAVADRRRRGVGAHVVDPARHVARRRPGPVPWRGAGPAPSGCGAATLCPSAAWPHPGGLRQGRWRRAWRPRAGASSTRATAPPAPTNPSRSTSKGRDASRGSDCVGERAHVGERQERVRVHLLGADDDRAPEAPEPAGRRSRSRARGSTRRRPRRSRRPCR
jgi:hypothetical protein